MAKKKEHWSRHPLFVEVVAGVVGAILGALLTTVTSSSNPLIERYFAIDNTSVLLDNYLVEMDYIDEAILEVDSLDQQFQMIQDSFAQYEEAVRNALLNLGVEQDAVSKMGRTEMLTELPNLADRMVSMDTNKDVEIEQLSGRIVTLETEKSELQKQVEDLKKRKEAELLGACLIVDGESMNNGETFNNAMAKIDGHYYYDETFIESNLLKKEITYDVQNKTIIVGDSLPEKVKFSWDKMAFNPSGIEPYKLSDNSTFSMAKKTYSEGLVLSENDCFYVQLDGKYSKMSFIYGHVDDTNLGDLELTFLAVDENNESYHNVIKTIFLPGEMTTKEIEVPIGYANTIKVVVSDGDDWDSDRAKFGLTDIYLYS